MSNDTVYEYDDTDGESESQPEIAVTTVKKPRRKYTLTEDAKKKRSDALKYARQVKSQQHKVVQNVRKQTEVYDDDDDDDYSDEEEVVTVKKRKSANNSKLSKTEERAIMKQEIIESLRSEILAKKKAPAKRKRRTVNKTIIVSAPTPYVVPVNPSQTNGLSSAIADIKKKALLDIF